MPRLTDLFVSGNVVGVDALAAIAAIMPVTIGALFVGKLVYCGSGYLFAKYQGEFRRDRARETVGRIALLAEDCSMALVGRHRGRMRRIVAETSVTVGKESVCGVSFACSFLFGLVREARPAERANS